MEQRSIDKNLIRFQLIRLSHKHIDLLKSILQPKKPYIPRPYKWAAL